MIEHHSNSQHWLQLADSLTCDQGVFEQHDRYQGEDSVILKEAI